MFYTSKDVMEILQISKSKAYEIIRTLLKDFQEEYPDKYVVKSRIPKWYLEEKMGLKGK